jgi:hypothetical protein
MEGPSPIAFQIADFSPKNIFLRLNRHTCDTPPQVGNLQFPAAGRVAVGGNAHGSLRPVRAHISAYGSSDDGFTMQRKKSCMPGLLS